ncbi:MAG TPA: transposase, partial [Terriglobia bacterium]|nr:transposase [Terriglobia bacterium]
SYYCLLHFFHSSALHLDLLTHLWQQTLLRIFRPCLVLVNGRAVVLADGLKRPKEGRKMPAVKSLHQESRCNAKAPFIMGHSLQAVAVLVQAVGTSWAVPVAARIHEGVLWSRNSRRTLLDKLCDLLLGLPWNLRLTLVADAYYAAAKMARRLLTDGHHLVTRLRSNAVAYFPPKPSSAKSCRKRGRPPRYGRKIKLREQFRYKKHFHRAASPVYGESAVKIRYSTSDLIWRPLGQLVRFVWVIHPTRGRLVLLSTDLTLPALEIIRLYGWRFKIEVSFKQAIHTVGAYAYHFWMSDMKPIRRGSGNQTLDHRSPIYRQHVRRKLAAYQRHIQLGLIAQGLLQYLALRFRRLVWFNFHSYIRSASPQKPPSEWVVALALRQTWPDFLANCTESRILKKFLASKIIPKRCPFFQLLDLDKAA